MKAMQIVASSGGAQGENLMEEYGYGFCGSELSNTSNMEDSVSNVLGDDEYSNFRLLGIGKPTAKQVVRKAARQEKRAIRRGGGAAAPSDADLAAMDSQAMAADTVSKAPAAPATTNPAASVPTTPSDVNSTAAAGSADSIAATTPSGTPSTKTSTGGGTTPTDSDDKIFGLSKPVFFGLAGVAVLVVGFVIYKKNKS